MKLKESIVLLFAFVVLAMLNPLDLSYSNTLDKLLLNFTITDNKAAVLDNVNLDTNLKKTEPIITVEAVSKTVKKTLVNDELKKLSFELIDNYPNPFNSVTQINYTTVPLNRNQTAEIEVSNSDGKKIWKKNIGTEYYSDDNEITYGTLQFDGSKLRSGVYYYKLIVDGETVDLKSMLLIKK